MIALSQDLPFMTTQNSTLFISDLHLNAYEPHITKSFLKLLNTISLGADALYILGDFFESYVGDDDHDAFIESIIAALAARTRNGFPIFLMHGNRDFLIGKRFAKRAGITLIPDPSVIRLYDKKILLMHGDSLCTKDIAHQRFRHWTAKRWVQTLFLSLPLSYRQKIAGNVRQKSMNGNQYKSAEIMDVSEEAVIHAFSTHQVDTLIHGHTHRPVIHTLENGAKRIVLGAWHEKGNYLEVNRNGEMAYREFGIE